MRAWAVGTPCPAVSGPLVAVDRPRPEPTAAEIRIRISACGVCRTDLHLAEGDLPVHRPGTVPGHEIVGVIDAVGPAAERFGIGQRVGIAWLRGTCGRCRWCRAGRENLCLHPRFTGWDDDGGFAEWAVVDEAYAYPLPDRYDDVHAAPLLCAGIIGYRALRRAELPPGGRLGIYGFGASAHLTAQVALASGVTVHVLTRSAEGRDLALEIGAHSAGPSEAEPPEPLDAAIIFAPAGELVPVALRALDRGGRAVLAGIHMSTIPALDYGRELFEERELRSVTANTRRDGEEFLAVAANVGLRVVAQPYRFDDANLALSDLAADRVRGAAVLVGTG